MLLSLFRDLCAENLETFVVVENTFTNSDIIFPTINVRLHVLSSEEAATILLNAAFVSCGEFIADLDRFTMRLRFR